MTPDVSVVMGVYNGADALARTMDSILSQRDCALEVILVDDGSTDDTPIIAARYAVRDLRVRVMHLRRVGLTRALMAGCVAARGAFIARHDCGDVSAPVRLSRQLAMMQSSEIVLSSVGTRFTGPAGEFLYEIAPTTEALRRGLSSADLSTISGPAHHGATMFRRSAYEAVGGYRAEFAVAQDLDLWLRLAEAGACVTTPDILYEASLAMGAISQTRRAEQLRAAETIIAGAKCRRAGGSDADILARWRAERSGAHPPQQPADPAAFYYFLGSVLRKRDPRRACGYFRSALAYSFWRPKTWLQFASASLLAATAPGASSKS